MKRSQSFHAAASMVRERSCKVSVGCSLLGVACLALSAGGLSGVPPEEDPQSIFNGKDLAGWDGDPRLWSVKDGAIRGETTPENPARGNTFLIWKGGTTKDFELRLSFRCTAANNSGIQYRSTSIAEGRAGNRWVVRGYQHEIRNESELPSVAGFIYEEGGKRGRMCLVGEKAVWGEDGKKSVTATLIDAEGYRKLFKLDDWNDVVIVARGSHIQHYLNGKLILDCTDEHPELARREGILALQLHAGKPMWAEFRDIRLEHLSSTDEPSTKSGADEPAAKTGADQAAAKTGAGQPAAKTGADQPATRASGTVYKKIRLSDEFHAEGAYYADFNRDGAMDVVAGPYWYAGPELERRHEVRTPQTFDPKGYSENFLTYTDDFNGDGWPDILYVPWPGKDAYWHENPAGKDGHWKAHLALENVGNESPVWGDVTGDGRPELVYNIDGFLGFGAWDPKQPEKPWVFHSVSTKGSYQRYTHGVGIGDIDGDGRTDILESACWWEQPEDPPAGRPWIRHDYRFADAGAQLLVYDVDGDGLNDVITAWNCHGYGLVWHRQVRKGADAIGFQRHVILSPEPDLTSSDLRISQLHAFDLVDMNGDGLKDILTGKRFWAHGPEGDVEPNAPAVVYWFELVRDAERGVRFIPHQIDDDSGVGTQVAAADLDGDKLPDVIVANKKGSFVFLSRRRDGPAGD